MFWVISPSGVSTRVASAIILASAQAPQKLGYQGLLLKTDGTPETGTVSIAFSIYADPTGGSSLWNESQTIASVANLVAKSILTASANGPIAQYRLLDTMRAYAQEKLYGGLLDIAEGRMNVENDFANSPLYCSFMNNGLCGDPKALPGGDIGHSAYPDAVWALTSSKLRSMT